MKVPISEAARILGVSITTLRRWDQEGKLASERTPGGHRRYDLAQLKQQAVHRLPDPDQGRITVGYVRLSPQDTQDEHKRLSSLLAEFCIRNGWDYEIIEDRGSGMNFRKKGLLLLIKRICSGQVGRLLLPHKDHLPRFGAELIFALCEEFSTEVVMINPRDKPPRWEEDLSQDIQEIIDIFSARLYGTHSEANRELVQALRDAAADL
jgi:excisionase family DNA binding protein